LRTSIIEKFKQEAYEANFNKLLDEYKREESFPPWNFVKSCRLSNKEII
jgi:hypothetical protein